MTVVISKGLGADPCSAVIVRHEDGVAYLPRTSWSSWIQLTRQVVHSCEGWNSWESFVPEIPMSDIGSQASEACMGSNY